MVSETLRRGVKAGVRVALAPLLTDLPIVLATLFILSRISNMDPVLGIIFLCGSGFLSWLAWESLSFKGADINGSNGPDNSLKKGVVANFLSPAPYLFWLTIGAPSVIKANESGLLAPVLFIIGFYVCLVGGKVVVAHLVGRSRIFLSSKNYIYTIRILGLVLLGFALVFLFQGIEKLF